MKNPIRYLFSLFLLLMVVFLLGKIAFVAYNHSIAPLSFPEILAVCWHGALLDMRVSALALLLPALCVCLMKKGQRWVLVPYFLLLALAIGIIIVADIVMYEFWQFKLSAVVLSYAASPEGTTNSVSMGFLFTRFLMIVFFVSIVAIPAIRFTPKKIQHSKYCWPLLPLLLIALLPVNVSSCYHPGRLFPSHAATNPIFRFAVSFGDSQAFASQEAKFRDIPTGSPSYATSNAVTDTLLNTARPNVLVVVMESFGGKFVEELGGLPGVAPNLSRLIPKGIFWDQYYSNSFRTDRGIVCTFSGTISYPTTSPMREVRLHSKLPSLAMSLHNAGYQTGYLYGGAMTNMGKYRYLADMGFEALLDGTYFTPEELNSSWGAHDEMAAMKVYRTIAEIDTTARWFMAFQTISSHEPWDVPYHRLGDKRLNAFAYTDHCLGLLIDSLSTLPAWDNMLVIIIPDHGYLYEQTYDDSEFFHSPMLWVGGAVKEPRRMHTLMNQSDIAATLLAQMGLSHDEYAWSRNVLAPDYTPFIYCNYPAGLFFKDASGESPYDLSAGMPTPIGEPADSLRLHKGLSILRRSYYELYE